jgi:hypothetical protein
MFTWSTLQYSAGTVYNLRSLHCKNSFKISGVGYWRREPKFYIIEILSCKLLKHEYISFMKLFVGNSFQILKSASWPGRQKFLAEDKPTLYRILSDTSLIKLSPCYPCFPHPIPPPPPPSPTTGSIILMSVPIWQGYKPNRAIRE